VLRVAAAILLLAGMFMLLLPGSNPEIKRVAASQNPFSASSSSNIKQSVPRLTQETVGNTNSTGIAKPYFKRFKKKTAEKNVLPVVEHLEAVQVATSSVVHPKQNTLQAEEEKMLAEVNPQREMNVSSEKNELSSETTKLTVLPETVDSEEEEGGLDISEPRKGLWQRAVALAQQANKLGIKSVQGEEEGNDRFRISFNAFSVEKR
jgi:hypothetical protein